MTTLSKIHKILKSVEWLTDEYSGDWNTNSLYQRWDTTNTHIQKLEHQLLQDLNNRLGSLYRETQQYLDGTLTDINGKPIICNTKTDQNRTKIALKTLSRVLGELEQLR